MNTASTGMSATVALTGMLPFVVVVAALLSLPTCFVLLAWYRRRVLRGMASDAGQAGTHAGAKAERSAPQAPLKLTTVAGDGLGATADRFLRAAMSGPWRQARRYAAAGLVYAVVMTACWLLATHDANIVWIKVAILVWTYAWPAVLAALLIAAYDTRRRMQLLSAYFVVYAVLAAIAVARNPELGVVQLPLYWLLTNGAGTVLLFTFLLRPIRAVGPLVLSFMIMASLGSQALVTVAGRDESVLRAIVGVLFAVGLGGTSVFVVMILAGIVAFAVVGWLLLRWIGRRYEAKKLSDRSITIDAMFLLFAFVQSVELTFEGLAWIVSGIVAFVAYKIVMRIGLRLRAEPDASVTLLLLRVFRLGKRSEQLFDKLRTHWQHIGSIGMIAGPDLVTTTVEPHEFLDFLSGGLARRFVSGAEDLARRLQTADRLPDPDGRYRINEFFCRNDTWQMTMEALARNSDVVLMDLRSFSSANQGCLFEVGRLLDSVDLARVLFLVDASTERAFLEATLLGMWGSLAANSPNRKATAPVARLFAIEAQSEPAMHALLRSLLSGVS